MGFLITLLIFAILFVLSELLRPKPEMEDAKPAGLGDFSFPTATEGRAVPLVWGTIQITGPNVVWYGNLFTSGITEKIKTGIFSSSTVTVGYRYYVGMQFALCRGPVDQLRKVWVGDSVLFDRTGTPIVHDGTETWSLPYFLGGDDVGGNGGMGGTLLFKSGTDTQTVSSYLSTYQKVPPTTGDTPAYRGVCYVVPNSGPWYVGNSASIKPWKFEVRRIPVHDWITTVGTPYEGLDPTAYQLVNSQDANPALVLYEILHNTEWGMSITNEEIDIASVYWTAKLLFDEGNGFSMILDQQQEATDLLRLVAEQMDAVVTLTQIDGLWTVKPIRPTADLPAAIQPGTPKVIDEGNLIKLENFTRGAWDGTVNQLLLEFNDRADEYKQTFAGAQDLGNIRVQDQNVRAQIRYPGVKDAQLANDLAWRELLTQSYPLAKASVIVDRTFWDTEMGDIVELNDDDLGVSDFQMRVAAVDLGSLTEGEVRLDLVEDIFRAAIGAFSNVPGSGWEDPLATLLAFVYETAFEAPRAFSSRVNTTPEEARIWCGARRVGAESGFDSWATTGSTYLKTGDSTGFVYIGKLKAALTKSNTVPWNPATTFVIKADPDDLDLMYDSLELTLSANQIGQNLSNLLKIGNELIFITAAQKTGGELELITVYRGALDTVQEDHAIDDECWILSAGGNLMPETWVAGDVVKTRLLSKSLAGLLDIGDASDITNTMLKRSRRPYPPVWYTMNGATLSYPASLDLEAGAGTWDTDGVDFTVRRRDYLIYDEVSHMVADAATLGDFPTPSLFVMRYEFTKDYATVPVVLYTKEDNTTAVTALLVEILRYNAGAVPASLRIRVYARHTDNAEVLDSTQEYTIDIPTVTATSLTGLFNMGADAAAGVSNVFTTASSGTHTLRIQTAFANVIQYRVNGGSWLTAIAAAATSGVIPATTAGDTIELRHSETATGLIQLAYLRDNTAAADAAYWVPYV